MCNVGVCVGCSVSYAEELAWQLDTTYEYSHFSRQDKEAWQQRSVQVGRHMSGSFLGEKAFVYGRHTQYDRNIATDDAFALGLYRSLGDNMEGYVDIEHVPDAQIKPKWRIRVGMEAPWVDTFFKTPMRLTINGQYDKANDRAENDSKVGQLGVRFQLNDAWQAHVNYLFVEDGQTMHGGKAQLNWRNAERQYKAFFGVANGPENEEGETLRTQAFFGGASYTVSPKLEIRASLAREDRKKSYIRDVGVLSLSFKF